jgi:hypothetical protein
VSNRPRSAVWECRYRKGTDGGNHRVICACVYVCSDVRRHPSRVCMPVSDARVLSYPVVSLVHVRGVCILRLGVGLYDVSAFCDGRLPNSWGTCHGHYLHSIGGG